VGGVIAANHVFNVAPRDGTLIGNVGGPIIIEQALGSPGIQFDMAKFRYLAVPASESYLMIATRKAGFTRFGELLGSGSRQIVVGGIPGSTVEHAGLLLRDVLGANIKVVSGYKGTSEIRLAMEGGEVQGLFNTWASLKVTSFDRFKSGEWPILLQLTDTPIPDLPVARVPTINDVTQNEEQRQLLRFGTHTPNLFGKVYVLPPGVPADRAQSLETAFARTFADKEFLAEAEKARLEIAPLTAEQVSKLVGEFLGMSPDLKAKLQKTLGRKR
jgi:tripartite-type tricarboxylate transporter receptor subunit TctC